MFSCGGSMSACGAGALLWFCCRRRRQGKQPQGGKMSAAAEQDSPSWGGASAAALMKRPFRKAPPKNLVASKTVDLTPPLMDPEQPSFTTGPHQAAPAHTPAQFYTQQISVNGPAEAAQPAYHMAGKVSDPPVVGGAGEVQNEGLDKAGMAHSDSAVSLPSNASSVQGPGTPIAPAVVAAGQCACSSCFCLLPSALLYELYLGSSVYRHQLCYVLSACLWLQSALHSMQGKCSSPMLEVGFDLGSYLGFMYYCKRGDSGP